jgi:hypothetical protein
MASHKLQHKQPDLYAARDAIEALHDPSHPALDKIAIQQDYLSTFDTLVPPLAFESIISFPERNNVKWRLKVFMRYPQHLQESHFVNAM